MPFYRNINHFTRSPEEKARIAENLLGLKIALEEKIPAKSYDNLLLATWNIREFDSAAYGKRMDEALYYIAEIVDKFDLVAVQEVRDDLDGLNRLMRILGKWWDVVFTDVTEGRPGNRERMAFVFDTRKVKFGGLSGEIVLPEERTEEGILQPMQQLARTPFVVGFQAGWYRFALTTVHLIYGESTSNAPERVREARLLSDFLAQRADEPTAWTSTLVLLGDFNIFKPDNEVFAEIARNFFIPEELQELPTNVPQNKHYDQIAFRSPYLEELKLFIEKGDRLNAGVFNFFHHVYTEEEEEVYIEAMGDRYFENSRGETRTSRGRSQYYKTYWRTHQMSDHLPMWVEIPIDRSVQYLRAIVEENQLKALRNASDGTDIIV